MMMMTMWKIHCIPCTFMTTKNKFRSITYININEI